MATLLRALDDLRALLDARLAGAMAALSDQLDRPTEDPLELTERSAELRSLRRALVLALAVWPAFAIVDIYCVLFVEPGRLGLYLALRAVGVAALVPTALWLHARRPPPPVVLHAIDVFITGLLSMLITISCVELGGLASPLTLGVVLVLLARGAFLTQHWRRGLVPVLVGALVHPLLLIALVALSPSLRWQLGDGQALAELALQQTFVAASAALTLAGSHAAWTLRRRVFESRSLGRYALRARIGRGGMGEVWAAEDRTLGRRVAVKIVRSDAELDETASDRFEREIRAMAELSHPHVVRLLDHGRTEDGVRYFVMELLEGKNLVEVIREAGRLPPWRAVELVRQAASALAEAHARGIVHRDLKPENIFVSTVAGGREVVKVLDFGLAKLASGNGRETREGIAVGSADFVAPEILRGAPVDARSDVYSLGAVLYEALTGSAPFRSDDARATLLGHLNRAVERPSERVGEEIPAAIERVVMCALRKEPVERYSSGTALVEALAACQRQGDDEQRGREARADRSDVLVIPSSGWPRTLAPRPLPAADEATLDVHDTVCDDEHGHGSSRSRPRGERTSGFRRSGAVSHVSEDALTDVRRHAIHPFDASAAVTLVTHAEDHPTEPDY